MRVLVTGITGFVGSHLAEYALDRRATVIGSRWQGTTDNVDHLAGRIELVDCDLRDPTAVRHLVAVARPDLVAHLAAQSHVGASWSDPADTLTNNIVSQVNLLEALRGGEARARILVVGSSEEYGLAEDDDLPLTETSSLRPLSPYGVSKVAQDLLGYQYWKSYGLPIVRSRAFNHSVGRHTPVVLRDDRTDLVDIRYISELRRYTPTGSMGGEMLSDGTVVWDMRRRPVSVWANGTWTKVLHLSCHRLDPGDRVLRLVTSGAVVEVTGDHSVMVPGPNGAVTASARNLLVGDRIVLTDFPENAGMWVHEDVAWFLGFFAAEGCITRGRVRVDNKDRKPLERCAEILLRHFGMDSYVQQRARAVWRLCLRRPEAFARWLQPQVYASDGNKRIPRSILNAQADAKQSFLTGYHEGDGLRAGHGACELTSFKTESPILALGLCYLVANTTRQRICLDTEVRGTRTDFLINLNSPEPARGNWGRHLEIPDDVIKKIESVAYSGEVWDFETEDHVFHAGIGGAVVHNTGPRRSDQFVESSFARQIAEIEAGARPPVIEVGNLQARRDYTDVRDIVRGYWLLLERGDAGEVYNLCSGRAWSIQAILDFLLAEARVRPIDVREDPARLRPSDVPVLLGDPDKIAKAVRWRPEIPFEQTLRDLLDYWRERTARG